MTLSPARNEQTSRPSIERSEGALAKAEIFHQSSFQAGCLSLTLSSTSPEPGSISVRKLRLLGAIGVNKKQSS